MLCDACQKQTSCLPSQLSRQDPQIRHLLVNLKACDLQVRQPQSFRQSDAQIIEGGTHSPRRSVQIAGDRLLHWMGDRLWKRLAC
ncbi:MAG: hypothetical protein VKK04_12440 [Synechococcales bacterium]|nr:hypothetical protein [Synechococcales bacterium]